MIRSPAFRLKKHSETQIVAKIAKSGKSNREWEQGYSDTLLDRIRGWLNMDADLPWKTVRDAISDLPDPREGDHSPRIANHWLNPGARVYPGHNGSPLDDPAKVLKAGDHGVPGGENMLAYPDGEVRYFTVRECARLQTFPDEYVFMGSWTETMRQLGNAVPTLLGKVIAAAVYQRLQKFQRRPMVPHERHLLNGSHVSTAENLTLSACPTHAARRR